jgi:hypothetical protein
MPNQRNGWRSRSASALRLNQLMQHALVVLILPAAKWIAAVRCGMRERHRIVLEHDSCKDPINPQGGSTCACSKMQLCNSAAMAEPTGTTTSDRSALSPRCEDPCLPSPTRTIELAPAQRSRRRYGPLRQIHTVIDNKVQRRCQIAPRFDRGRRISRRFGPAARCPTALRAIFGRAVRRATRPVAASARSGRRGVFGRAPG